MSFIVAAASWIVAPKNIQDVLTKAKAGDFISLRQGWYGDLQLPRGDYQPSLIVDARLATFTSIVIRSTSGIKIRGGVVRGSGEGSAVMIDFAKRVRLSDMTVSGARVGITASRSTDVDIVNNKLNGVRSDGINLAMVQRVNVLGNHCLNFWPIRPTFDAGGRLIKDGDHPDCIQGWSRLGYTPTSDILIEGNVAYTVSQGIWFGDPGQGGYDRVIIRNNVMSLGYWQGIALHEARRSVIRGNRVRPIPGIRTIGGNRDLVWPWIAASGDVLACGNFVAPNALPFGTSSCD